MPRKRGTPKPRTKWVTWPLPKGGLEQYTVLLRSPEDPARVPRPKGGRSDRTPHHTISKTPVVTWKKRIKTLLADGHPRTFNHLCIELCGVTADVACTTKLMEALEHAAEHGDLEHTIIAPILWRLPPASQK